jgi:hypothetical protein
VKDHLGRPIPGLAEKNFRVYEDGKLVTTSKGKRALLEPKLFDTRYVLLLVDMSGPIVDSEDLPELTNAIGAFVDHVGATHEIAVGAFDGNDEVVPFLGYTGTAETKKVVQAMQKFRPRSRNANLNGAVYQGLHSLRDRLKEASAAQKSAILVIFTDRGELAHSVSPETLKQGLKETPAQIYVIGVGESVHRDELTALGRSGAYVSFNPKNFKEGFDDIAKKLTADADGRYVFSYCSPKRRGSHRVDAEGARSPHVQVQRRRLHGGLHAEEADGPRPQDGRQEEGRRGPRRRRELIVAWARAVTTGPSPSLSRRSRGARANSFIGSELIALVRRSLDGPAWRWQRARATKE